MVVVLVGTETVVTAHVTTLVVVTRFVTVVVCVTILGNGLSPPCVEQSVTVLVVVQLETQELVVWSVRGLAFAFVKKGEKNPVSTIITIGTSTRTLNELIVNFARPVHSAY